MDSAQPNPIYQRLTRNIDPAKQKAQIRLAIGVPVILVGVVTASTAALVMASPMGGLVAIALVLMLLFLAVLPAITAVTSSSITYREAQSENFQLLEITTLTRNEIVEGFIKGIRFRLLPLRRAGECFAIAITTAPFIAVLVIVTQSIAAAPPAGEDYIFILPAIFAYAVYTLILAIGLWGVTFLLNELAVVTGVNLAISFRNTHVSVSNMSSAFIVLVVGVVGIGWLVMTLVQTAAMVFSMLMLVGGFLYILVQTIVVN